MNVKGLISDLQDGCRLDFKQAKFVCDGILDESINASQIAAILALLSSRSLDVSEVLGFRNSIKERGTKIDLGIPHAIDLCGTGGDNKQTFNISTATAFIVASLGYKVVKHGNYSVSSKSGSSDILQSVGYEFSIDRDRLLKDLDKANVCFLHAPLFYPILKNVGQLRRDLGFKTIFNVLGPLLNPAEVKFALTGVYDLSVLRLYSEVLPTFLDSYFIVHTLDGYDEVSLTANARVVGRKMNLELDPASEIFMGAEIRKVDPSNLLMNEIAPKECFIQFLKGQSNLDLIEVVAINAALAICTLGDKIFSETKARAVESIKSGAGFEVLNKLVLR